jgi:hypothetical protein
MPINPLLPFLAAAEDGDVETLELMLAPKAVLHRDGAAPIVGAARVAARLADDAWERWSYGPVELELTVVNGRPSRLLRTPAGTVVDVLSIDGAKGRIDSVYVTRSPAGALRTSAR